MPPSALLALLLSLALPALAQLGWTHDGGSSHRSSYAAFPTLNLSQPTAHAVFNYSEPEEDTLSQVEEYLLQSPLVTSPAAGSNVLLMLDSCSLVLLPDPAALAPGAPWAPMAEWQPATDPNAAPLTIEECEASGVVLSDLGSAYFLDSRNKLVHALTLNKNNFQWQWSVKYPGNFSIFDADASMLVLAGGSQLYVPLRFSLEGTDGVAWVLDTAAGATIAITAGPGGECRTPDDFGSCAVEFKTDTGVAQLSDSECGALVYNSDLNQNTQLFQPAPNTMGFMNGVHSHPVYEPNSGNMYYINFQDSAFEGPQQVCCYNFIQGAPCWSGVNINPTTGCGTPLPVVSTGTAGKDTITYRWTWLALGLDSDNDELYIVMSGAVDEDPLNRKGVRSALTVVDTRFGFVLATDEIGVPGDMFCTAPLVLSSASGSSLLIATTGGLLVGYTGGAPGVADGPAWASPDLPTVPLKDFPASTHSFLSTTPAGTVLLTTTAGGSGWKHEKAFVAVANGAFAPQGAPSTTIAVPSAPPI